MTIKREKKNKTNERNPAEKRNYAIEKKIIEERKKQYYKIPTNKTKRNV